MWYLVQPSNPILGKFIGVLSIDGLLLDKCGYFTETCVARCEIGDFQVLCRLPFDISFPSLHKCNIVCVSVVQRTALADLSRKDVTVTA